MPEQAFLDLQRQVHNLQTSIEAHREEIFGNSKFKEDYFAAMEKAWNATQQGIADLGLPFLPGSFSWSMSEAISAERMRCVTLVDYCELKGVDIAGLRGMIQSGRVLTEEDFENDGA